jgi:hypothetical protein
MKLEICFVGFSLVILGMMLAWSLLVAASDADDAMLGDDDDIWFDQN